MSDCLHAKLCEFLDNSRQYTDALEREREELRVEVVGPRGKQRRPEEG